MTKPSTEILARTSVSTQHDAPAAEFDIENSFGFQMVKLVNILTREFQREFEKELDISLPEWRVLAVLTRTPGLSAAEVAQRTGHNQMVISRAVKRLVEMKRIVRTAYPTDGRRRTLTVTEAGMKIFQQISPLALRWERVFTEHMLPQDIIGITRTIDIAVGKLDPNNRE